jgi:hypothetical protein
MAASPVVRLNKFWAAADLWISGTVEASATHQARRHVAKVLLHSYKVAMTAR